MFSWNRKWRAELCRLRSEVKSWHTSSFYWWGQNSEPRWYSWVCSSQQLKLSFHLAGTPTHCQCKVVMHPDRSVTRCLVCPAVADGPGLSSLSTDCCTTEKIHIPQIQRQHSALLCAGILYDTHLVSSICHPLKGCSLAVGGSHSQSMWPLWCGWLQTLLQTFLHSSMSSYI